LAAKPNSPIPDAALPAIVRFENVFAPVISGPVSAVLEKVTLLKVSPPPAKVGFVLLQFICEDPALNVKLVDVVNAIGEPPEKFNVLLPKFIVLAPVVLDDRPSAVMLLLLVVNVPAVTVKTAEERKSSPRVAVIPAPLIINVPNVCPAEVIVPVPAIVIVLAWTKTIPATSIMLPDTVIVALTVKFPVNPVQLIDLAPVFPAEIVTVFAPEVASKYTSSADVGTAAPVAPPTVAAHLLPAVPSQAAVPPRQ